MNLFWCVILNNALATELLIKPNEQLSHAQMEELAFKFTVSTPLRGTLHAWQLGRIDPKVYSNLRDGAAVVIPSESILFVTVMQKEPNVKGR